MTKQHVHIIKMGGTIEFIDPAYDAINAKLMKLDPTVDSYLHNVIQPHFTFSVETVASKDSRDINEADREKLSRAIKASPHESILVTHSTFTMVETAAFLVGQDLGSKKVILTGAMVPVVGFSASDGGFNLGFSIASLPNLQPGVYICMNGGLFGDDEVTKNPELLRFE